MTRTDLMLLVVVVGTVQNQARALTALEEYASTWHTGTPPKRKKIHDFEQNGFVRAVAENVTFGGDWYNNSSSEKLLANLGTLEDIYWPVDCCQMELQLVQPIYGINMRGESVELYKSAEGGGTTQKFYEMICRPEVLEKPCLFMRREFHLRSRCAQLYSYSYALIKAPLNESDTGWVLDYIQVKSGCSCEVLPRRRKKKEAEEGYI